MDEVSHSVFLVLPELVVLGKFRKKYDELSTMVLAPPLKELRKHRREQPGKNADTQTFPSAPLHVLVYLSNEVSVSFKNDPWLQESRWIRMKLPRMIVRIVAKEVCSTEVLVNVPVKELEVLLVELVFDIITKQDGRLFVGVRGVSVEVEIWVVKSLVSLFDQFVNGLVLLVFLKDEVKHDANHTDKSKDHQK